MRQITWVSVQDKYLTANKLQKYIIWVYFYKNKIVLIKKKNRGGIGTTLLTVIIYISKCISKIGLGF